MLNQVILIGRLTHDPELKILDDGKKVLSFQIAVQRCFKNLDGIYETDFIPVTLWQGLAENLSQYCVKGTLIALRARLQMKHVKYQDNDYKTLELIGERVTYLSSPNKNN
ncbi:MAG: single-stranded DNA-binding protein [Acholeplasmatales bacterium]|jgi:single-strand DNA-binding protein|nr:single-stranded DNA-binding protein [Acholeplasmataceae bacterium]MDY0115288.1 single-stranded DNA-binding protein [Acholeplasmatales bacterium]MCK9233849.1 single-stranded DNA-binding protein [Acholeplasmataceae bacterium]MCK9289223.1 single-stranded DNA-binding protein [Acholeplasmataceae bacterium]MCK9427671.1 single-stranded DNA-binding protein [Acholeplasmataceae bacterium]